MITYLSALLLSIANNALLSVFYPVNFITSLLIAYPSILQIDEQFKGFMGLFLRLYTAHGICFLWHGCWAEALAYYHQIITGYFVNKVLSGIIKPYSWCNEIADQVSILAAYPLKLASTRMIIDIALNDTLKYSSIADYFATTFKDGGVSLLFTGYLLDKGSEVLTLVLRRKADKVIRKQQQQNCTPVNLSRLKAALSFGIEAVAFLARVIRHNTQLQAVLPKELYSGIIDCCVKMYLSGGLKLFYYGAMLKLAFLVLVPLLIFYFKFKQ